MKITKIIDELAKLWLGKCGVYCIYDEQINGEKVIVFGGNFPQDENYLPKLYKDYKIITRKQPPVTPDNSRFYAC